MPAPTTSSLDFTHERTESATENSGSGRSEQLGRTLSTLGNRDRRAIVELLAWCGGDDHPEMSISRIAKILCITRFSASRHLRALGEAGIVILKRKGTAKISVLDVELFLRVEDWVISVTNAYETRLTDEVSAATPYDRPSTRQ